MQYPAYTAGNVSSAYDADGNATSMTDCTGTTRYTFDARNRQTQKTLPNGGTFSYGLDAVGNLTSLADAASVPGTTLSVTYGYNALNLVTSLVDPSGTTTFAYDQNHQRLSTTFPDGVVERLSYDTSGRLASIAGKNGATTLTSFAYSYTKPGGGDTMLPYSVTETLTSPTNVVTNATVSNSYDQVNRLSKWLVTNSATNATIHDYTYQFDGVSNRTQIIADPQNGSGQIVSDPSLGVLHSNESDLSFNAANEIAAIVAYGAAGTNPGTTNYTYDAAGNQTGNDTVGATQPGLRITYLPTNQTASVTNDPPHGYVPVTNTWTGAGQGERTQRQWTVGGVTYISSYTWSALGLSGYTSNRIGTPGAMTSVSSWIVRDPSGTPIAQRYSNRQEYYYLFNGQGDVVALEDPGQIMGAYDFCPTGNEADSTTGTPTIVAKSNSIQQVAQVKDDDNKLYFGTDGTIMADYNGTGTKLNYVSRGMPNFDKIVTKLQNLLIEVPYDAYYNAFF